MTSRNAQHIGPGAGLSTSAAAPVKFGKYYLLDRINVGGMAEIFKAVAANTVDSSQFIAVKRILPAIAADEAFITMFIDEAEIAAQLSHPNIAQVLDVGKVGSSYYIALEFVSGHDLRVLFDRARKRGTPLPIPMVCYLIMKVCEGLSHAHTKKNAAGQPLNLVHRDVSQQNVLVSYDGDVKLIDFGVAKAAGKVSKTEAGILKGKFSYMSPEQVRGLPLDQRSDIFSTGICLYELLTNERLFVAESDFSTLEKVRNVEIMPPSTYNRRIPEELEHIVLKALSKDAADRQASAAQLHDDLQSFMYTSSQSFSQKDLAAFMNENFKEDLLNESSQDKQYTYALRTLDYGGNEETTVESKEGDLDDVPTQHHVISNYPPENPDTYNSQASAPVSSFPSAPPPPGYGGHAPLNTYRSGIPSAPPVPSDFLPGSEQSVTMARPWSDDDPETRIYEEGRRHSPIPPLSPSSSRGLSSARPSPFQSKAFIPWTATMSKVLTPRAFLTKRWMWIGGAMVAILGLLFFFWPKAPASIQLTTVPSDPLVLLDNQPVSSISSPFIITGVSPDKPHTLEVRKTGYQPWSTTLTINAGQALQLPPVNLEPIGATVPQATATGFFLDTEPSGAQVYVDGQLQKERTPVRITNLKPGNHTIQAEDPGTHQRWETELVLVSGQMVSLPRVRLNAAQVTTSSASPTAREETAQADHPPRQKRARATSEPDVAAPSEGSGTLQINSTPWSQIFINGDLVGNTPQMSLSLPAGTHQVRLVNPEFNLEKTLTVKIRANKTTKKILSLQGSGQ